MTLIISMSCVSLLLLIPVVLKAYLPIKYLHVILLLYHQVLCATAGNAVVTSAFVYIRCHINNCNNNNDKQICKSKSVSVGSEKC